MDLRKITEDFSVSPQIEVADVPDIAEAGYRAILCNRPDGEEMGQPVYEAVAEAARAAGLQVQFLPIISGQMTRTDAEAFSTALDTLPKPILAYCRTGTRCTVMWSMTQIDTLGAEEILRRASDAGYDMSGLVAQLQSGR
ncbi:TIGR01244 family sulfur transferase [Roseovarius autotrophicus]|uniref:TIGR01244 family sulfur transferase n=1 Tax=Roseovarius autotrophicus TaxID=2824121 RepID=UPI0019F7B53D|nr:TIGR01244 family sulfur transferase [Roseovarius autotrophicus]MBE0453763.1 TIGR01244 family phosphatase [Roseovarius sp.]